MYHSVYQFAKYSIRACFPHSGKHRLSVLSTRKVIGPQLSNISLLVSCQMCLNSSKKLFSVENLKVLSISSLTTNTGSGTKDQPKGCCCRSSIKCINPTINMTSFKLLFQVSLNVSLYWKRQFYWPADKILGCMDHNPFELVERTFSIFQLLLF